jgi:SAM-dependent methyltransferase
MRRRTTLVLVAGGAAVTVAAGVIVRARIRHGGPDAAVPSGPRSLEDDEIFTLFVPGGTFGFYSNGPVGWVFSKVTPILESGLYDEVTRMLDPQPEDELLDIGCGSGAFLATRAQHVRRVVGLDVSPVMLREAERRLARRIAAGTARIVAGNAGALPFGNGEFSAATSISSVARPSEVFRVLRPGGRFIYTDLDPRRSSDEPATRSGYPRWGEDDYRRMFGDAGFIDVTFRLMRLPFFGDCLLVGGRKPAAIVAEGEEIGHRAARSRTPGHSC